MSPVLCLTQVKVDVLGTHLSLGQQLFLVGEQLADLLPGDVGRSDDVHYAGEP